MDTQPLEVADFSSGITDYYIDGTPQEAQRLDNLVVNTNRKLETRWGSIVVNDQLGIGATRVSKLAHLVTEQLAFQGRHAFRRNGAAWTEVLGPNGLFFFPYLGSANSVIVDTEWRGHLFFTNSEFSTPQKFFIDNFGNRKVLTAGLPELPVGAAIALPGAGSTYLYAFVLKYTYTSDGATFVDRGPVQYYPSAVVGTTISGGNPAAITTIPTALTSNENWDYTNIEVEVYRTIDAGDVYYLVTTFALGTTFYNDVLIDATLQLNEQLYTTGGIAENNTPPKCKIVHVVNDFGYYAATEDDEYIIYQSKIADVDSVPPQFFNRTEQKIKGVSSTSDRVIVLCERYIYRIDSNFADDGTGEMLLRRIDDKAGCVSATSVVQTGAGLFWAGVEGFFWSDGFRVAPISDHLNNTYKIWTQNDTRKSRIQGKYDQSNQRVYWTVVFDDASEPDQILVLDLKFPFLPQGTRKGGTFSTWSGAEFIPTSIDYVHDFILRGDSRGYVLEHSADYFTDPQIDTGAASSTWEQLTIIHDYKSCFLDFGSKFYRKFVPRILVSAGNTTNLSLAIHSSNDNNRTQGDLKPIRYRSNITWGDSLPYWSDPQARWNFQGMIEEWRRFPAGGLRCNYKQVQFTNALVNIINSDVLGNVSVDIGAKTATLGGAMLWLSEATGYFIAFEHDNYTNYFEILSLTPTTVVYSDPLNQGPPVNGSYKFNLKGKPKGEFLSLQGYVIHWSMISKSHTPFSSSSMGGNPA